MTIFYKKLNLELDTDDWRFLNYLSYTYLHKVGGLAFHYSPQSSVTGTTTSYKSFGIAKSNNNYRDKNIFKKIANLFKPGTRLNSVDVIYYSSQISFVENMLIPHTDDRKCAITIPLISITEPVYWYKTTSPEFDNLKGLLDKNSYIEIASYNYDSPASLINTSIYHGTPDNTSPRIFFQLSIMDDDIETVIDSLI